MAVELHLQKPAVHFTNDFARKFMWKSCDMFANIILCLADGTIQTKSLIPHLDCGRGKGVCVCVCVGGGGGGGSYFKPIWKTTGSLFTPITAAECKGLWESKHVKWYDLKVPTTSSFSTWHLASKDSAKTDARQYDNLLSVGIWCVLY